MSQTSTTAYAIRERHDTSYWRGDRWTPASDEAKQFDSAEEAQAEGEAKCEARSWVVVEVEAQ